MRDIAAGEHRRRVEALRPSGRPIERLEGRDLMAFVVGPVSAAEDQSFQGTVATFAASDVAGVAGDASASIAWGDGTTTAGRVVADPGGGFDVAGLKTYARPGRFPIVVTLTATDPARTTTSAQGEARVAAAPLTLTSVPFTTSVGKAFSGAVASFQDAGGVATDYTATIRWGDGEATTDAEITGASGSFAARGTYTYRSAGPKVATITLVRAVTGQVASVDTAATVATSALSSSGTVFAATTNTSFTGVVASFLDTDATTTKANYTAVIDWGAGQPNTVGTIDGSAGRFTVSGTFAYAGPGTRPVSVTVARPATGQTTVATSSAIVAAANMTTGALPLIGSGLPIAATAGQTFIGPVASFTDPKVTTNTDPGVFTATISWGDGTSSPATISSVTTDQGSNPPAFFAFGSHTYASAGTFLARVTVIRKDSGTAYALDTTATVRAFVAALDPLVDLGGSNTDGVTSDNQPRFLGTVEPLALVRLFARKSTGATPFAIGETIAASNGRWSLTTPALPDGTYVITGEVVPTTGAAYTPAPIATIQIDTVAPRALGASYNPKTGQVTATFRDDRSGLDPARLLDPAQYVLVGPRKSRVGASKVTVVSSPGSGPADPKTVVITFNLAPRSRKGKHTLRIVPGGLTDLAGNGLGRRNPHPRS